MRVDGRKTGETERTWRPKAAGRCSSRRVQSVAASRTPNEYLYANIEARAQRRSLRSIQRNMPAASVYVAQTDCQERVARHGTSDAPTLSSKVSLRHWTCNRHLQTFQTAKGFHRNADDADISARSSKAVHERGLLPLALMQCRTRGDVLRLTFRCTERVQDSSI